MKLRKMVNSFIFGTEEEPKTQTNIVSMSMSRGGINVAVAVDLDVIDKTQARKVFEEAVKAAFSESMKANDY